jgi:4-alpha-glucanotransferase
VISEPVARLRDSLGFPGMVVLQFGFDEGDPRSVHRFENHAVNRIVYTGTHDHDTARGWYSSLDASTRSRVDAVIAEVGVRERQPWWSLIRLALASRSRVAMMQAQDVLGLGSEARMNAPGRAAGAWRWRMERGALKPALARRLREATEASGRVA